MRLDSDDLSQHALGELLLLSVFCLWPDLEAGEASSGLFPSKTARVQDEAAVYVL